MVALESSSPEETERIAARLATFLRAGDLVTVAGELGAGKTTFVRGAARALGVTAPVTSPTYTVGHRHAADPDVSHIDLYRFESMSEDDWGDLEGYFEDAVAFVEWPEKGAGYLDAPRVAVRLRLMGAEHRLVEVQSSEKSLEIALSEKC
ncbi:MAG TPA: tRNA (adenosine(37)-N6)-threonylcarbamoyltransferase complex ATPase subunit type 1 TsaE [Gaiellaceae bacterium]|jgi:tRNA threonylcarbamoyladenosine biosynthesis protein TsaE